MYRQYRRGTSPEKYLCRLKDQENFKCIALVVLYNKEVAGYVCIYPYSTNGILGEEGFSEIVDLGILEKYKDLGIKKKLLDITEQIASEYSNIVYTSVKLRKGSTLNMFFYVDMYLKNLVFGIKMLSILLL